LRNAPLSYPELAPGHPLGDWLAAALDGQRLISAASLSGGYRNDNVLLVTDDGRRYVLRRYRHDAGVCAVEAALVARLTAVAPVAAVVAADPDGAVAGEPVLLSRYAPGKMVESVLSGAPGRAGAAGAAGARQLGVAVGAALAAVGTVSFDGPGFFTGADLVPRQVDGLALPAFVADCLARRHPDHALTERECAGLRDLAEHAATAASSVDGSRRLVHADFNPKNLLARHGPDGWTVTAVLDWEFTFSGSPLFDVGNLLRFADGYPPAYVDGFLAGFVDAGGHLPPDWREVSRALDLYALAEFTTRPTSDVSRRAVALLRRRVANSPPAG
jgi:aminoglycoside phosphotransferase (APT) family kinase protein